MTKIKDIQNKNTKELSTMLSEKQVALRTFRFGIAGSNLRNVKEGKALKLDIARLKTVMNQEKTEKKAESKKA